MLKIYGLPFSAHTRKVIIAAIEKNIPYEIIPTIPLTPPPNWIEKSPLGLIPVIEDGDTRLADSSAICLYLERKYPNRALYPHNAHFYAQALWIEEFVDSGTAPHVLRGLLMQRVFAPKFLKQAPDEGLIRTSLEKILPDRFSYLEKSLAENYFAGDCFSIADIAVASILINFHYAGEYIEASSYPRLYAFLRRILNRPSFAAALKTEMLAAKAIPELNLRLLHEVSS